MQSEIEKAIKRAGLKLGGGLLLLAALIGIRVVTAQPDGIESEVAKLEQFESEVVNDGRMDTRPPAPVAEAVTADAETSGSILSGLGLTGRASSAASGSTARDADRLVSCELPGSVHFMRGADCATRGGRATDLD